VKDNVTKAVALLQARTRTRDPWRAEQAEEALNFLLSKPDRTGDPQRLVRNALAEASKKLRRRAKIFTENIDRIQMVNGQANDGLGTLRFDLTNLIRRGGFNARDRSLLSRALDGSEAEDIAQELQIPIQRARERLSRARARAQQVWGIE
jgi:hypothetical protein